MSTRRNYVCKECGNEFCTCPSDRLQNGCPECGATWPHTCVPSQLTDEEKADIERKKIINGEEDEDGK